MESYPQTELPFVLLCRKMAHGYLKPHCPEHLATSHVERCYVRYTEDSKDLGEEKIVSISVVLHWLYVKIIIFWIYVSKIYYYY